MPQNIEAEMSVLGVAFLDKNALTKICEELYPDMFYSDANRKMFVLALSCPNPLCHPPIGPDTGLILPEPPLQPNLRPGYRSYPARTRASGAGASSQSSHRASLSAAPGNARRRCPSTDWPQFLRSIGRTRSEPPRRVLRGGESPSPLSHTPHLAHLTSPHLTSPHLTSPPY